MYHTYMFSSNHNTIRNVQLILFDGRQSIDNDSYHSFCKMPYNIPRWLVVTVKNTVAKLASQYERRYDDKFVSKPNSTNESANF